MQAVLFTVPAELQQPLAALATALCVGGGSGAWLTRLLAVTAADVERLKQVRVRQPAAVHWL